MYPQTFIFTHANYTPLNRINYIGSALSPTLNIQSPVMIFSLADDLVVYYAHPQAGTTPHRISITLSRFVKELHNIHLRCISFVSPWIVQSPDSHYINSRCINPIQLSSQVLRSTFGSSLNLELSHFFSLYGLWILRVPNVLKAHVLHGLSNTRCGDDPVILFILYKSVICSKMDYGAFLFNADAWTHSSPYPRSH